MHNTAGFHFRGVLWNVKKQKLDSALKWCWMLFQTLEPEIQGGEQRHKGPRGMRWGKDRKHWWNEPWSRRVASCPHLQGTHFLLLVEMKYIKEIKKKNPALCWQRAIQQIALHWQEAKNSDSQISIFGCQQLVTITGSSICHSRYWSAGKPINWHQLGIPVMQPKDCLPRVDASTPATF